MQDKLKRVGRGLAAFSGILTRWPGVWTTYDGDDTTFFYLSIYGWTALRRLGLHSPAAGLTKLCGQYLVPSQTWAIKKMANKLVAQLGSWTNSDDAKAGRYRDHLGGDGPRFWSVWSPRPWFYACSNAATRE